MSYACSIQGVNYHFINLDIKGILKQLEESNWYFWARRCLLFGVLKGMKIIGQKNWGYLTRLMSPLTNLPKMSMCFTLMHMKALCIRLNVGRHINVLGHLSQNKQWGWKIFTYDYQELFETSWKYWYELSLKCLIGHHVLSISIEFLHFHVQDLILSYISQVHLIFPY
jgi:hypothetical protein